MKLDRPARDLDELPLTMHEEPLQVGDFRYVDLSEARGDSSRRRITKMLARQPADTFLHLVLASHRGSGKTTEIQRIMNGLQSHYCLYFEANIEANAKQLDLEDLLLVLARKLFEEAASLGFKINPVQLKKIEDWFGIITQTTMVGQSFKTEIEGRIGAGANLDYLGELQARFASLIKFESEHREELKTVLRKYSGSLTDIVNILIDNVSQHMEKDQRRLLVVIDNLDRYDPEQMDRLLIRNGDSLTRLRCNLLLTPPISMVYRPKEGKLEDYYTVEVMHSVRLRSPAEAYTVVTDPARRLLLEALAKRIDIAKIIPSTKAQDRLLMASGGAMRELLALINDAALDATDTITEQDVERAVARVRAKMRDVMNVNGWVTALAQIGTHKQIFQGNTCMDILYHRYAFHYNKTGWYDIHPLIAEMEEYQTALAAARPPRNQDPVATP